MSSILTSGCGITFGQQGRASWTKVLRVCGIDIVDAGGPAVSNEYILNKTIETICNLQQPIDHVVCQLTGVGKLDIDVSGVEYQHRQRLPQTDNMRNFTWEGLWPSSSSKVGTIKKDYYKWYYSERLELQNIIVKLTLLDMLCNQKDIPLTILQGYFINWKNVKSESYLNMLDKIDFDKDFVIYDYYKQSKSYAKHDYTGGNNLPNKQFAVHFAKKMNREILHLDIENKLAKFNE
tara:strand:- start:968 stop:1672 length:705 start_codon:yes stop_codon:yes gene_type:complete